ncbi:TPA: hypothetical protein QCQ26_005181 [Bacillus cereus]|nr:hypothetical protein [Bacillus cereus]
MDGREGKKIMNLSDVVARNRDKLLRIAERNTHRNEDGLTVVKKDDPWRREDEHPRRPVIESRELVKA